ncbi:MAG: hypothetical protein EOM26_05570 [Alphaproteobacteria bacterium]|nr:hypothetical protein [Alphaproteobacteria bacterium]
MKLALYSLGYYDGETYGFSDYGNNELFEAIRSFQKSSHLESDGVVNPDGPTHIAISRDIDKTPAAKNALLIFEKNRQDMIGANTIGADKYFHCKANYESARLGRGGEMDAYFLSAGRELSAILNRARVRPCIFTTKPRSRFATRSSQRALRRQAPEHTETEAIRTIFDMALHAGKGSLRVCFAASR